MKSLPALRAEIETIKKDLHPSARRLPDLAKDFRRQAQILRREANRVERLYLQEFKSELEYRRRQIWKYEGKPAGRTVK